MLPFCFHFSFAQILHGIVLEETTKGVFLPLVGAPVYWLNYSNLGTITDTSGVFYVQLPENKTNEKLVISYLGYKSGTILVKGAEKMRVILAFQNSKNVRNKNL